MRDPVDSTLSYYMHTALSCYKQCLKSKRDKMLLKKKNIVEKSVYKIIKERKKGNCTQAGYYLFLWIYFKVRIFTRIWRIMSRHARHALDNNFLLFEYSSSNVW